MGGSDNYWQEQFQEGIEINDGVPADCQMYSKESKQQGKMTGGFIWVAIVQEKHWANISEVGDQNVLKQAINIVRKKKP